MKDSFKPCSVAEIKVSPFSTNSVLSLKIISTAFDPNKSEETNLAIEFLGILISSFNKNLTNTLTSPPMFTSEISLILPTL